jgi:hypothetical protein
MASPTTVEPDLNALKELAGLLGRPVEHIEAGDLACPRCLREELTVIWIKGTVSLHCRNPACQFDYSGSLPRDGKLLARLAGIFSR